MTNQSLRFGICIDQNLPWRETVERWQLIEQLGYDSIWNCDHLIQPSRPTGPYFEAWTQLAALAALTSRVRIGVLVSSNTFRHPALLAKEAMTVDHISNGRLEVGLGAGWYVPEHEAFGLAFPSAGGRVRRFREAVEIVDGLLRQEITTYAGRYYQLKEAPMRPLPVQRPRPPLVLGAHGPQNLLTVALYADTWNSSGNPDQMRERGAILDEHCARIGRDPSTIVRSVYGWAARLQADPWASTDAFIDVVGRYRAVGVTELLIDGPGTPDGLKVMERVAADVLPKLRTETATGST